MNKAKCFFAVAGLSLFLCAASQAKEEKVIQFTTLPEVVRTTVFHRYNIVSPEKVVRVVEYPDNIFQVTVLTDSGEQTIFVNAEGTIVERPSTVVGEREEGTGGSAEVTVTMDQIQSGRERYEFVQDQGPDAIYIDHQTNKRVIVKGAAGKGSFRMKEENRGSVRTEEQDRSNVRSTEKTNEQSGTIREKNDNGNANQGEKNMRQEHRTGQAQRAQDQRDQGNRGNIGNGQEQRDRDTSGNPRTEEKNAGQRNMPNDQGQRNMTNEQQGQKPERETNRTPGEQQQSKEKSTGKGKASPTP
jgi:hypothetical protein